MSNSEQSNVILFTPAMKAEVIAIEAKKQNIIYGFLLANGITDGAWDVLPDGSGIKKQSGPKE